jgi:CrcB protein
MVRVLLIGLAGAIGTLLRYFVGVWAGRTLGTGLPWATFLVNVVGCFLIAGIAHAATVTTMSPTARITLMTGFVGGLTTYSSFNLETTRLFQERAWASGLLNLGGTLIICCIAGLLGVATARRILGP